MASHTTKDQCHKYIKKCNWHSLLHSVDKLHTLITLINIKDIRMLRCEKYCAISIFAIVFGTCLLYHFAFVERGDIRIFITLKEGKANISRHEIPHHGIPHHGIQHNGIPHNKMLHNGIPHILPLVPLINTFHLCTAIYLCTAEFSIVFRVITLLTTRLPLLPLNA